ncbi:hypothetical protein CSW98_01400 [Vibrio sp. HA2012]|uniref:hypothetical protein n=1 Tax=Vibrio sp. HA2012 TaxID=1971595 RepID=UPI000C2CC43D|nr:hypothetical protein [Vibrio sp. HA2012]PJC87810.1 hypothetical protein CSW98_01400 [Vibrio sp. HA2012]
MRFTLLINQSKSLEWGISYQQAALFSCLYEIQSWAKFEIVDGKPYYWAAKNKILEEIPLIFDKPDTLKRHFIALEKAGLIERVTVRNMPYICITEKGKEWNKTNPNNGENKAVKKITTSESEDDRAVKNITTGSEKDHDLAVKKITTISISDQNTSISNKKNKQKSTLDFSGWPSEPSEQIFTDWKTVRDKKRAPITQTVINRLAPKLERARDELGMSVDDVLGICVERGWQGFEIEWIQKVDVAIPIHNRQASLEGRNRQAIDDWIGGRTFEQGE